MKKPLLFIFSLISLFSCSSYKKISKTARRAILHTPSLHSAFTGISIYEPATNKYWYNYRADSYFIPASNVKIATCYAVMKYLGDSLPAARYQEHESTLIVEPTGDPSFLHPDFKHQPLLRLLQNKEHILINNQTWQDEPLGPGWSWEDYAESFMVERSPMPIYGNQVYFKKEFSEKRDLGSKNLPDVSINPSMFKDSLLASEDYLTDSFHIKRAIHQNRFQFIFSPELFQNQSIPFITNGFELTRKLLRDTLKKDVRTNYYTMQQPQMLYSQKTDSLLKNMMQNSDNFLAEQTLLMVSNEVFRVMNSTKAIDFILNSDFSDLPQKPRWVDGSGLSRYNLFTPRDFVHILKKLKDDFGMNRLQEIFATGNEGSLKNYYQSDSSFIYAKTGSFSGVVALSGYLFTRKNKLLTFSILINNHTTSATEVRRKIEGFLQSIRQRY